MEAMMINDICALKPCISAPIHSGQLHHVSDSESVSDTPSAQGISLSLSTLVLYSRVLQIWYSWLCGSNQVPDHPR